MIRLQVSAAFCLRDGYSGKPVAPSAVRCYLDGRPFRPEAREGGYLVFVNLPAGPHEALLRGSYYQDERVAFTASGGTLLERNVTLKPAANYPFPRAATQLTVVLREGGKPAPGRALWVAEATPLGELKLAQDEAGPGSREAKLYFRGGAQGRFPRDYLVSDGERSEAVPIAGAQEGRAAFDAPLQNGHKRGVAFYPAQAYRTNGQGEILAFFREPVKVEIFDPARNALAGLTLKEGQNRAELPCGKE